MEQAYLGHNEPVFAAIFSDDGKKVFSAGRDRKIRAWSTSDTKGATEKSGNDLAAFDGEIFCLVRDAKNIFAASADKTVRQYSIEKREQVRTFSGHNDWVYCLALDAASKKLASGGYDGEIRIWNIENGEVQMKFFGAPGFHETSSSSNPR
jgi:WD40 repeat protein